MFLFQYYGVNCMWNHPFKVRIVNNTPAADGCKFKHSLFNNKFLVLFYSKVQSALLK